MSRQIRERDLKPWLRGRPILWPLAGAALLVFTILVIPFIVLWSNKDEVINPILDAISLTICRIKK